MSRDLTTVDHWEEAWAAGVRLRLPSRWICSTRDLQRLLNRHVRPGGRVLEVGCAPGKILAWLAAVHLCDVSGLDYSDRGIATARRLFTALELRADLRCEDLRAATFEPSSFDLVYSVGVIEHFEDPRDVVARHVAFVRPGGTALMIVPNYGGIYGRLQRYFDGENLGLHNLRIMTLSALASLAPTAEVGGVRTYLCGRVSPWLISLDKRWPRSLARAVAYFTNAAALVQPIDIGPLCSMLVLEIMRPAGSLPSVASLRT